MTQFCRYAQNEVTELNDMYKRIEGLCKEHGVNMTVMCRDAGVPRSNLSDLKYGRTAALATVTLSKIAAYFNVPLDFLLGNEETKKAPTPKGEREIENERIIEKLESDEALRAAVLRFLGM